MKLVQHTFRIVGATPLLQNNPASYDAPPDGEEQTVKAGKGIPSAEKEAAMHAYKMPNGQLYGPASGLRKAILTASKGMRIGKATARPILTASIFPERDEVPLIHPKSGKPIKDYAVDVRGVVVKTGMREARVRRGRARVDEWAAEVAFKINEDFLSADVVLEFLQRAGSLVGWMDNRPERGGTNGLFTAELLK